jgi:putative ABC transport system permease protein
LWTDFVEDTRHAVRWLLGDPVFALIAITLISLGIGSTSAVFTVLQVVVIAPLPYPQADRLAAVAEVSQQGALSAVTWPNFSDIRREARSVSGIAALSPTEEISAVVDGEGMRVSATRVSGEFFEVLGVPMVEGRDFLPHEQMPGGELAAIVTSDFREHRLGEAAIIPGARIQINGLDATIIGVIPTGAAYPAGTDLWSSLEIVPDSIHGDRTAHNFEVIARLRAGASLRDVRAELNAVMQGVRARDPAYVAQGVEVRSLRRHVVGDAGWGIALLMGASLLLLLIACSNLAGVMLSRSLIRRKEFAIRIACGAQRNRLVRQVFTEALLLSALGAAAGIWLGHTFVEAAIAVAPDALPRLEHIAVDNGVLAFTTAVAVLTAFAFGALPALQASRVQPRENLEGARRPTVAGVRVGGLPVLVGLQAGLALLLLVTSGLMVRSVWKLLDEDAGFELTRRLVVTVTLPESRYDAAGRTVFYDELLRQLRELPAVHDAGITLRAPLSGWEPAGDLLVDGVAVGQAAYRVVSPGLFETLGMRLLRGRWLSQADDAEAEPVAIINEALARHYFSGRDPLGAQFQTGGMDYQGTVPVTVVGVVNDVRHRTLDRKPEPAYYLSYAQRPQRTQSMAVVARVDRTHADPASDIRAVIRGLDPEIPLSTSLLEEGRELSLAPRRFVFLVLGTFAALAVVMTAAGIYGLVAFSVAARSREIGIRIALGAPSWEVLRAVAGPPIAFVCGGIVVGTAGALAAGNLFGPLLYNVQPFDPATVGLSVLMLTAVALVASVLPARRAAQVDPVDTLRAESI